MAIRLHRAELWEDVMSVPTHGSWCQTVVYVTNCWTCSEEIHVLQCTCGSAVLFDTLDPDWDKHDCWTNRGIGGSGYSGWQAVDVLRSAGAPISASVIEKVFPTKTGSVRRQQDNPIQSVDPRAGKILSLVAIVRELTGKTRRVDEIEGLTEFGRRLLHLPAGDRYRQVTLIVSSERPNLSYTCLVPERLCSREWGRDTYVFASVEPRVAGTISLWLIKEIHAL